MPEHQPEHLRLLAEAFTADERHKLRDALEFAAVLSAAGVHTGIPDSQFTEQQRYALSRVIAVIKRERAMADPCGGNTKGGDGCSCDPPF